MALTDKDILITPNRGQSSDPKIVFSGADAGTGPQTISLNVYPQNNGTLSFEGSAGQLFSITNSMSGTIYSVNDVSGIPSIEVLDTGLIKLAQYSGNILLGTSTDNGSKLQVNGTSSISTNAAGPILKITQLGSGYGVTEGNAALVLKTENTTTGQPLLVAQDSGGNVNATLYSTGELYIKFIYDKNNTAYYCDPSSASSFNTLTMNGAITFAAGQSWPTFNQNTTGSAATLTTARILTIGSTGKTFNGSADVSWTLDEIGAAASSHTHNYAGSSSAGGAATSLSGFTNSNSSNAVAGPDTLTNNGIGYVNSVSLFSQTDGALYAQAYSTSWVHQIFGDYRTGQLAVRGKNNGTWQAWRTVWDSSNLTNLNQLTNGPGYTTNTGTVTSVGGTGTVSGLTLSGTVTTSGSLTLSGTLSVTPSNFASQTANTVLAAPNGAAGTPTFRALVAADIPTLNQNTTGTAANVTGTVAIANGGTGATTAAAALTNLGALPLAGGTMTGAITFAAGQTWPTFNQNTTGNAATATTATNLNSKSNSTQALANTIVERNGAGDIYVAEVNGSRGNITVLNATQLAGDLKPYGVGLDFYVDNFNSSYTLSSATFLSWISTLTVSSTLTSSISTLTAFTTNKRFVLIVLVGGGGGGEGGRVGNTYNTAGGDAGETICSILDLYPLSINAMTKYTCTIGAGGAGGTATVDPTAGANTIFNIYASTAVAGDPPVYTITAPGGGGGSYWNGQGVYTTSRLAIGNNTMFKDGTQGTGTDAALNRFGGGGGAATPFGVGANGGASTSAPSAGTAAAANTGAGGGGGALYNNSARSNGGAGGSGVIKIYYV